MTRPRARRAPRDSPVHFPTGTAYERLWQRRDPSLPPWRCKITAPHNGHGAPPRACPGIDFPDRTATEEAAA